MIEHGGAVYEIDHYHDRIRVWYPTFKGWIRWAVVLNVGSRIKVFALGNLQVHFACIDGEYDD